MEHEMDLTLPNQKAGTILTESTDSHWPGWKNTCKHQNEK